VKPWLLSTSLLSIYRSTDVEATIQIGTCGIGSTLTPGAKKGARFEEVSEEEGSTIEVVELPQ